MGTHPHRPNFHIMVHTGTRETHKMYFCGVGVGGNNKRHPPCYLLSHVRACALEATTANAKCASKVNFYELGATSTRIATILGRFCLRWRLLTVITVTPTAKARLSTHTRIMSHPHTFTHRDTREHTFLSHRVLRSLGPPLLMLQCSLPFAC